MRVRGVTYEVVVAGRDLVESHVRALEAGAPPLPGHTLETLRQLLAELDDMIAAHQKPLH